MNTESVLNKNSKGRSQSRKLTSQPIFFDQNLTPKSKKYSKFQYSEPNQTNANNGNKNRSKPTTAVINPTNNELLYELHLDTKTLKN